MIKSIYKYWIDIATTQPILIPKGGEILSVQVQNGSPQMWVLVDPIAEKEERFFEVFGTGHRVHSDMGIERKFLGTVQMDLDLVFHVFERIN